MTTANGTPGAANPLFEARDKTHRVRQLIRQIAGRRPLFRGLLRAMRRDLGELADLTGADPVNLFVSIDGLDQDIADLVYWARRLHAQDDKTQAPAHNAPTKQSDPP